MKTFWMFVYWVSFRQDDEFLQHCTVERTSKPSGVGPIWGRFAPDGEFAAKLTITLEDFDRDCFDSNGLMFVSEKMRRAMALGPSDIQYFDVDASESTPLVQSKNYKIMHVPVTEDVSDLKNSDYMCAHRPDGSVEIGDPLVLAFRPDADPVHELFHDQSFRYIFCTDEFALRVLQAGCSGVVFFEPPRSIGGTYKYFRTLRGVEEIVKWNKKIFRTKLIRELP